MDQHNKKILFMVQFPKNVSPGQRFRFELYEELLKAHGFVVTTKYFLDKKGYEVIHKPGLFIAKIIGVIKGFFRRMILLLTITRYDYILLQREAAPVGPHLLEWLYIKLFKRKVIYDFDDAIWIPHISDENSFVEIFKNPGKVKTICKWAYKVSCGNQYLCDYARQFSSHVVYNPTCVDTDTQHNIIAVHDVERLTIGWTGSFSTLKYLDIVQPALKRLQEKYDFDIKIICNKQPDLDLKNIQYIEWSKDNEVVELASCQIGLMPLTNDEWSEGKCGFKLIQYLALQIPAVSSPVGVNKIIVEDGINGFFCQSDDEWYTAIEKLILDKNLRKQMGLIGREKIINHYSVRSNAANFLGLFS